MSCVVPNSKVCNTSMQMSHLLGLARQQLRCAVSGRPPCRGGRGVGPRSVTAVWHCTTSKFPWPPTLRSRTRLCTKHSRTVLGAATRGTPKPPSCDHEQPALCRGPATALGRAAPMATTKPEGASCSSRKCPQWRPACTCLHTRTRRSIPVSVVSSGHLAFCKRRENKPWDKSR